MTYNNALRVFSFPALRLVGHQQEDDHPSIIHVVVVDTKVTE